MKEIIAKFTWVEQPTTEIPRWGTLWLASRRNMAAVCRDAQELLGVIEMNISDIRKLYGSRTISLDSTRSVELAVAPIGSYSTLISVWSRDRKGNYMLPGDIEHNCLFIGNAYELVDYLNSKEHEVIPCMAEAMAKRVLSDEVNQVLEAYNDGEASLRTIPTDPPVDKKRISVRLEDHDEVSKDLLDKFMKDNDGYVDVAYVYDYSPRRLDVEKHMTSIKRVRKTLIKLNSIIGFNRCAGGTDCDCEHCEIMAMYELERFRDSENVSRPRGRPPRTRPSRGRGTGD